MPEIKVPETGGVVRRALDERRRLSNVARGAMEAWKVPRGRNGWIRPVAVSHGAAHWSTRDGDKRPLNFPSPSC